jgi:hypothetical protein
VPKSASRLNPEIMSDTIFWQIGAVVRPEKVNAVGPHAHSVTAKASAGGSLCRG